MALTLAALVASRDALVLNRASGVLTFRDSSGELVTYRSDGEMARAIGFLDAEIAKVTRQPVHTICLNTSKGI